MSNFLDSDRTPPPVPAHLDRAARLAGAGCYALGALTGYWFLNHSNYSEEPSVRFHAWQSIYFTVAAALAHCVWGIGIAIAGQTIQIAGLSNWDLHPYVFLSYMALGVLTLLAVHGGTWVLWILLMLSAADGGNFSIPLLTRLAADRSA